MLKQTNIKFDSIVTNERENEYNVNKILNLRINKKKNNLITNQKCCL